MEWALSIVLAVLLIAIPLAVHRGMTAAREAMKAAWARIETLLRRRHELVAGIVTFLEGAPGHDRALLLELVTARQRALAVGRPTDRARAERDLEAALRRALASSPSPPPGAGELPALDSELAAARKDYNLAVARFNAKQQAFPGQLLASAFHFKPAQPFKID